VAVVTGACGILGRRLAAGLAEAGAAVAAIDLDAAACDALAAELTSRHGIASVGVRCDVSKPDEIARMVEAVEARLGPIDVLLNNAASRTDDRARFLAPIERYELETWRAVNAVNLDGLFLVAQAIGSRMAQRGRGSIVQTASIYGVVAPDPRVYEGSEYHGMSIATPPVYSASKAAVIGLTRHLAATWGPKGVRVNALTPGGIFSGQNEEFQRRYGARTPLGRMAEADEMVGAAIFLASDAASYVTGHNLVVDGGFTIW
jgi:NAD(P)-dependent dehydrogenase (short-subunit alcohol dehydrogenase family)